MFSRNCRGCLLVQTRWIQLLKCVTDYKCGIGISSIFDTVFRYLPIFLAVLRYWVSPNVPLFDGGIEIQRFASLDTVNQNVQLSLRANLSITYFVK